MPEKGHDLPERLSPMTVKELRQGLRRSIFVLPFLGIHVLATLAMIADFKVLDGLSYTDYTGALNLLLIFDDRLFSGFFWLAAGIVFLLVMPLGGLVLMQQELEEGNHELLLMTPLTRWKVVRGKFFALWGLCLLSFCTMLPYVVVSYFSGNWETKRTLALVLTIMMGSGIMCAAALGASAFRQVFARIAIFVLFLVMVLISGGIVLGGSAGVTKGCGFFYHLNAFVFCGGFIVMGLALARSRIRLVVQHYEIKPGWMVTGLVIFSPFVTGMATAMTGGYLGGGGVLALAIMSISADQSPKAPSWVPKPEANIKS